MTVEELFNTKAVVRNGIQYSTPRQLLEPIIDRLGSIGELTIKTSSKVENANEDESINLAYNRVLVQSKMSDISEGLQKTIGLVYAIDIQKPIVKVYTGTEATACTNLCVFNAENVFSSSLSEGMQRPTEFVNKYMSEIEIMFQKHLEIKEQLTSKVYDKKMLNELIGEMLFYSNRQGKHLGTTAVVNASKLLDDKTSSYYANEQATGWQVYNAVTQYITDKSDIFDKSTKTLVLSKFFNIN